MTNFRTDIAGTRYQFGSIGVLLAKASPARSGDQLAGIAAESDLERMAARFVLADLPLKTFLQHPVIPYERDEVTRLIVDTFDEKAFEPVSSLTVGAFREWLLSNETTTEMVQGISSAVTPEMAAAVCKLMRNQDLILVARKCEVITAFRNTIGVPGHFSTRLQPNHPTDDLNGIAASIFDGLMYGSGDAVIGINPATDNVAQTIKLLNMLDELINQYNIPTQSCVLTHVTNTIEAIERGAGEVVLNCMDMDGVRDGYDIEQLQAVRAVCSTPLIASGGAGRKDHFKSVFELANVDGALAASVFHKGVIEIGDLKAYLGEEGIRVRP